MSPINANTVLIGERVLLVPYKKIHVDKYHEWMMSAELREMTASEPLSLEEEYGMQESWATDEDKLTFIVLSRPSANSSEDPLPLSEEIEKARMIGDVNMFFHEPEEEGSVGDAECEVMIAELDARRKGLAYEALSVFLRYATSPPLSIPTSSNLMAKISTSNPSSLGLFNKLGFQVVKLSEVWQEWELRYGVEVNGKVSKGDWTEGIIQIGVYQ